PNTERSVGSACRLSRPESASQSIANSAAALLADSRAVPCTVRRNTQHACQRSNWTLLIDLHLRWNHHGLLDRELGIVIADDNRWRRDLLHAELWRNAFAGFELVAITAAAAAADLLRRSRHWNIGADFYYRA